MHLSLSPALEAWLQHKVDAGLFPDLATAAEAALMQQARADAHLNWQHAEVLKGLASLEEGGEIPYDSEAILAEVLKGLESLEKHGTVPYDPQKIREEAMETYQAQKLPV